MHQAQSKNLHVVSTVQAHDREHAKILSLVAIVLQNLLQSQISMWIGITTAKYNLPQNFLQAISAVLVANVLRWVVQTRECVRGSGWGQADTFETSAYCVRSEQVTYYIEQFSNLELKILDVFITYI